MQITEHRLQDIESFTPTEKTSGNFAAGLPDTIVIHYTATRNYQAAVRTLSNPRIQASAHLVIGREGQVVQLVDFNKVAWHAGRSSFRDRNGLNKYSIGIEIDNPGWLTRSGDKFFTWDGSEIDAEFVVRGKHRNPETKQQYWHRYTVEQIQVVTEICEALTEEYGIKYILGHEEISPGRKQDPGPAFPLEKVRQKVLGTNRRDDEEEQEHFPMKGVVEVSTKLNIRAEANGDAEKVAKPLRDGQSVTVLEENDGWYRVRTEIEGWVSKRFVQPS